MGKTVESYRMALEGEISRWCGFARALRKPDREAFDELMDMYRSSFRRRVGLDLPSGIY